MKAIVTLRYYTQVSPDDWEPQEVSKEFDCSVSLDEIMSWAKIKVKFPDFNMLKFTDVG